MAFNKLLTHVKTEFVFGRQLVAFTSWHGESQGNIYIIFSMLQISYS